MIVILVFIKVENKTKIDCVERKADLHFRLREGLFVKNTFDPYDNMQLLTIVLLDMT